MSSLSLSPGLLFRQSCPALSGSIHGGTRNSIDSKITECEEAAHKFLNSWVPLTEKIHQETDARLFRPS